MLRLDKLKLSGFKSFSEATEVTFPAGVTAIVGPNGCGKSNIGDALNWVLGEQSARSLRGASMQDVIFNGSEARKAQGMAEVSLHLAETESHDGEPRREVVVTRRLFRSGESDYLLNGARARLRDIQDLLREARVGAQTYATIEQGRIDQILNAKPKERRLILEEAAGIAGFKHKRRLAELKLDATQANLLRVNDIVLEVQRQINSLKRQAAAARRYQRLREELRAKEGVRFATRARRLDDDLARLRRQELDLRQAEAEMASRLGVLEAEMAAGRQQVEEGQIGLRREEEALHHLEIELDREETRTRLSRERIAEAESLITRLTAELTTLTARRAAHAEEAASQETAVEEGRRVLESIQAGLDVRLKDLEAVSLQSAERRERIEGLRRGLFEAMSRAAEARNRRRSLQEALERNGLQRRRLDADREGTRGELDRIASDAAKLDEDSRVLREGTARLEAEMGSAVAELDAARIGLERLTQALRGAREEEQSAVGSLKALEDVASRFAGVSDGVRMLLSEATSAGLSNRGVVADYVEATRDAEGAVELYLGGLLPAVILESQADIRRAVALLRDEGAGRTYVLSPSQPAGRPAVGTPSNGRAPIPEAMRADPRVEGRLKDCLSLKWPDNGFIHERIGDAVLVDSLDSALDLHRQYPDVDYLTRTGEVVYASGVVAAGGRSAADHGLLAHNRRIHDARLRLTEASGASAEVERQHEESRAGVAALERRADELRQQLAASASRLIELELRVRSIDEAKMRTGRRTEVLACEMENLEEEFAALAKAEADAAVQVEGAEGDHRHVEATLNAETKVQEAEEGTLRDLTEAAAVLRAEVSGERERQAALGRELDRLRQAVSEIDDRIRICREESEAAARRAIEAAQMRDAAEADHVAHLEERGRRLKVMSELEGAIQAARLLLQESEAEIKAQRSDLEARREALRVAELSRSRAEAERQHLDDLCQQELSISATQALEAVETGAESADPDVLEAEVQDLKQRIEKIGPVNLMAIEEFSELEQRYTFLTAQRKDLTDSIESLKESIRRINRSSRERFLEVFEIVRKSYQEIFRVLFNGGRADLSLEEGDDVLESGIEILAQPPGKRLGGVSLLSGGEKAMAAIALLFAIFRHQPSPFCLLDEVDAALDDLNVQRFTRMLREYAGQTQFILITHNKRSMESSDLLYGVTMEEPGISKLVSVKL